MTDASNKKLPTYHEWLEVLDALRDLYDWSGVLDPGFLGKHQGDFEQAQARALQLLKKYEDNIGDGE